MDGMNDIDVDNFAGGGGASTGVEWATGRPVTIAINHSEAAIAMHRLNHPDTRHYREDVWEVDPIEAAAGRRVRILWLSPDCTHHSRAKGGQPREKKVRGLAWIAVRWARAVKPRIILLENVEEFEDWGPVDDSGRVVEGRKGETFRAFVSTLQSFGYAVDWRRIVAADHGSPTTRRRLFLVARADGRPIVWPEATHGSGRARPWRTAAECIDWSIPCPSIFGRKKPLAPATLARIAAGLRRYVIESARPFIVPVTHQGGAGRVYGIDDPMRTVTAANRGEMALAMPYLAKHYGNGTGAPRPGIPCDVPLSTITASDHHTLVTPFIAPVTHTTSGDRAHAITDPLRTVTTAKGGEFTLVAPTLVQTGYGEREGQAPRTLDIERPLGTVVSGGKHALVSAFLAKHYTLPEGRVHPGVSMTSPVGTVTTRDHHSVVTASLGPASDRREDVKAFLVAYYKSEREGQRIDAPLRTVPTHDRFGLVTVHGVDYEITDIGLRMLAPRELFRAQGFPDDYRLDAELHGRPLSKTAQIELAGNSVCPQVAHAIAAANLWERWEAVAS